MIKWFGAALVMGTCGYFGFSCAATWKREEHYLRRMVSILDYIQCELQFRMTPLPDLCHQAGMNSKDALGRFLLEFSDSLEKGQFSDPEACVAMIISRDEIFPELTRKCLSMLGSTLGRFDLEGQIQGIESVRAYCREEIEKLNANKEERLRGYQTLGLCAGSALAILFV